jgi:hypothetical protein
MSAFPRLPLPICWSPEIKVRRILGPLPMMERQRKEGCPFPTISINRPVKKPPEEIRT